MNKQRLDQALVARGLASTRARAQGEIKAGSVLVNGARATRSAHPVRTDDKIEIRTAAIPYVSRGGVKLARALSAYDIDPAGQICIDLGASTGGFCDVLLRAGAAKIYAVDVGRGQLHADIARDPRVINLEGTHANMLSREMITEPASLAVCDVSFVSLRKVLGFALDLCADNAQVISLVKPQFELGPKAIGRGGIVKADTHEISQMLEAVRDWFRDAGWRTAPVIDSPIAGGDGNREFLIAAGRGNTSLNMAPLSTAPSNIAKMD